MSLIVFAAGLVGFASRQREAGEPETNGLAGFASRQREAGEHETNPARSAALLNAGWKFHLGAHAPTACNASAFATDRSHQECMGLSIQAQIGDKDGCLQQCCGDQTCEIWQWCDGTGGCKPANSCWTGVVGTCKQSTGWLGSSRPLPPTPPPPAPGQPCAESSCTPSYDDSHWRIVDLPHDFIIEGNFTPDADKVHGYLPYNTGWYRLHFDLAAGLSGLSVWLSFDGIQRNSVVYLNGKFVGSHLSGYTSFRFNIEAAANFGGSNVLAVFVDATQPDGWWRRESNSCALRSSARRRHPLTR
jgi:hypothetical protein